MTMSYESGIRSDDALSDDEAPELVAVGNSSSSSSRRSLAAKKSGSTKLAPCPVTILSGFLGSGKTTLIQNILKSPDHGKRIAVIENEFGEGLDIESLIARDGVSGSSLTDLIELPNGCLCCTVKDSLITTLEGLLDKRSDLDYIIIECSGMANPGPIAALFWLDDALESRLRLDGIITLVDAPHILHQLATTEEAAQQIAYADRILLNKIDLIDEPTMEGLIRGLRRINTTSLIRPTKFSMVADMDWILDTKVLEQVPNLDESSSSDFNHDHDHHGQDFHSQNHHHADNYYYEEHAKYCVECAATTSQHKHTNAVKSMSVVHTGSVDVDKLDMWLAAILWPNQDGDNATPAHLSSSATTATTTPEAAAPTDSMMHATQIFRVKGVLAVHKKDSSNIDDTKRHIVQAVHDLWDIYPSKMEWQPDEERRSKIVIIGRNLPEAELREGFLSCFS